MTVKNKILCKKNRVKCLKISNKVDWNYIKTLKYGNIAEYTSQNRESQLKISNNLAGYVREKRCIDCKQKTIKFNRCKECYYKFRGWTYSHLLDKQKEGSNVISTTANEGLEILTDSSRSFRSDGAELRHGKTKAERKRLDRSFAEFED